MSEGSTPAGRSAEPWDAVYESRGITGVSWFQPSAVTSIGFIKRLAIPNTAAVIDVGGGASVLADALVERGFRDVSVLDVSDAALEQVRQRLPTSASVSLLPRDLLSWKPDRPYDLWHVRAMFHFLVESSERDTYLRTLRLALRPGGVAIIATFAPDGPESCSAMPVARYSSQDLAETFGADFVVIEHRREQHITPAGVMQPFTWVAARLSP